MEQKVDSRLQRIANVLLLNTSLTNNIGLLDGKMGIAIFFYQYSRYTGNQLYEDFAGELIDQIYNDINSDLPIDFAKGLMGIGWGFEYLVKEKFIDADTDEVLTEIDRLVFRSTLKTPLLINNQDELFGFGLYYLARLQGRENDNDNLQTIFKKQVLTYLHDDCERLFTKKEMFGYKVPILTINQINSIAYFLLEMQKLKLFPVKLAKLEGYLPKYIIEKAVKTSQEIEYMALITMLNELSKNLPNNNLKSEYLKINELLKNEIKSSHKTNTSIQNGLIKSAWYSLLYKIHFYGRMMAKEAFCKSDSEDIWNHRLEQLSKDNLGLDNGMAGLGLAILNAKEEIIC